MEECFPSEVELGTGAQGQVVPLQRQSVPLGQSVVTAESADAHQRNVGVRAAALPDAALPAAGILDVDAGGGNLRGAAECRPWMAQTQVQACSVQACQVRAAGTRAQGPVAAKTVR